MRGRLDILNPDVYSAGQPFMRYHILGFLLKCPAFSDYKHREDVLFQPPLPIDPIPRGEESIVDARMLPAVLIDENDYAGDAKLIPCVLLKHLGHISIRTSGDRRLTRE